MCEMRVPAIAHLPTTHFCLHPFVHWMARLYSKRHSPPTQTPPHLLLSGPYVLCCSSAPKGSFSLLGPPPHQTETQGSSRPPDTSNRLCHACLARIPTRKTRWYCWCNPSLERKVGGTEDRAPAALRPWTTPTREPIGWGQKGRYMDIWCWSV